MRWRLETDVKTAKLLLCLMPSAKNLTPMVVMYLLLLTLHNNPMRCTDQSKADACPYSSVVKWVEALSPSLRPLEPLSCSRLCDRLGRHEGDSWAHWAVFSVLLEDLQLPALGKCLAQRSASGVSELVA